MDTRTQIIATSERIFDHHGFTATGMDQLTAAAEVSSRTLYKHLGNKNALIAATLENRRRRFFAKLDVQSVDALFQALIEWSATEGARGCFFLRAASETGGSIVEISAEVTAYRDDLHQFITRLVAAETDDPSVADIILILFEGAVSTASYRGIDAITAARNTAAVLMKHQ